jgi:RNA polymerase sigma-70 factor (ECF subfamily)
MTGRTGETDVESPEMVARIRRSEPEALGVVIRAYLKQVYRTARGAGLDDAAAEEVAQATFTTFVESAGRFEGRSKVRTWVFGILFHKIAEARRGQQKDRRNDPIDDVVEGRFRSDGRWAVPPQPLDDQVFAGEVRRGIESCLEEVPRNQRMAFILREVEGMETPEICKILDVTRTNLGVLLYRARNRLRECLEAKGVVR